MSAEVSSRASQIQAFLYKWTPRAIAVGIGGYYGLGVAYEMGMMAAADRIAIRVIRHFVGYMGVGALMPTFPAYASWSVRITLGIATGILYDLSARCTNYAYSQILCSGVAN